MDRATRIEVVLSPDEAERLRLLAQELGTALRLYCTGPVQA
jgi:hypothetical protein